MEELDLLKHVYGGLISLNLRLVDLWRFYSFLLVSSCYLRLRPSVLTDTYAD